MQMKRFGPFAMTLLLASCLSACGGQVRMYPSSESATGRPMPNPSGDLADASDADARLGLRAEDRAKSKDDGGKARNGYANRKPSAGFTPVLPIPPGGGEVRVPGPGLSRPRNVDHFEQRRRQIGWLFAHG